VETSISQERENFLGALGVTGVEDVISGVIFCNEDLDVLPYDVTYRYIDGEVIGVITNVGGTSAMS